MDPVSAAASIVAIVQISSAVLGTCYRYINKVKDAPADIFSIISEVGSLQVILDDLNSLGDGERLPLTTSLAVPGGPVDACLAILKELEAKLSAALTVKKKLLWPFEAKKVDELVGKLQAQKSTINLAVTSDNTRATLGIGQVVADIQESIEDTKQRERRDRILQWLATTDPTTNHNAAHDKHEPNTGSWLLESEGFRSWRDSTNEFLWLHAIPGAGKTIICSTVIEHITLHSGTTHRYAYYYFDFSDPQKQRISEMLKSLISQLSSQSVRLLGDVDSLYEDCAQGLKEPSIKGLVQLLTSLLKNAHSYIIIDALDECTDREDFYPILRRLRDGAGFSLLITSRKEVDIDRAFNPTESPSLVNHIIDIQHEAVSFDVRLHVRASLAKVPRLRNWPDAIKKEIEDTLANGAHGMFRWVVCQLDTIRKCLRVALIRKTLQSLPQTLEETYDRIFNSIPNEYEREFHAVLMLLSYSFRPMTIQEVAEAISIDVENSTFDPENRLSDPYDILEICSTLVTTAEIPHSQRSEYNRRAGNAFRPIEDKLLQFSHFSVKEYILSNRPSTKIPASLRVVEPSSHKFIAELCLIYLLDFSGGVRLRILDMEAFPLLLYAPRNWIKHWQLGCSDAGQGRLDALLTRLFDTEKLASFLNFLNLYNPASHQALDMNFPTYYSFRNPVAESRNAQDYASPLYYACFFSIPQLAAFLITKGADVNSRKGILGFPLQAAAFGGSAECVKMLLDNKAQTDMTGGKYGSSLQCAARGDSLQVVEMLLNAGGDVNVLGGKHGTVLQAAARKGNVSILETLLDRGADVKAWGQLHGHALQAAALSGNERAVKLLLQRGADINAQGGTYGNALQAASAHGHLACVIALVEGEANLDAPGGEFGYALHAAIKKEKDDVVDYLLKKGANVNATGGTYGTALQASIEDHRNITFKMVLAAGADINIREGIYGGILEAAVYNGNVEAAHILLDKGADVYDAILLKSIYRRPVDLIEKILDRGADPNADDDKHGSALLQAIAQGRDGVVDLLLQRGADINIRGGKYDNALQCSIVSKMEGISKRLLEENIDVNMVGGEHGTALQAAAYEENVEIIITLLSKGADPNTVAGEYGTALIAACISKNREIVRLLLAKGANPNLLAPERGTALQAAAGNGDDEMIQMLLEAGADVNLQASDGSNALQCAVRERKVNVSAILLLLQWGADVNARGGLEGTCLQAAFDRPEIVTLLLDHGADVNNHAEGEGAPLYSVAAFGDLDNTQLMLDKGADVNTIGGHYGTALMGAIHGASSADDPVVRLLLNAGADINVQCGWLDTALHAAIYQNLSELAIELIDRGADINAVGKTWGTPMENAIRAGDETVFRHLLEKGADIHLTGRDEDGMLRGGVLRMAAWKGYVNIAQELLVRGASVNPSGNSSQPLMAAVQGSSQDDLVRLLLGAGADVNRSNGYWGTPLQAACKDGDMEFVKLLLKNGADINAEGGNYGPALSCAAIEGHHALVQFLIERGADVDAQGGVNGTALMAAIYKNCYAAAEMLLKAGANVELVGGEHGSALELACWRGLRWTQLILEAGADVQMSRPGEQGGSPLISAAQGGENGIVTLLLERGVDVNFQAGKLGCALQAAARCKKPGTLKLLLNSGRDIDVNARGGKYGTPLQAAACRGKEHVRLLLEHGADPNIAGGKFGSPLAAAEAKKMMAAARLLRLHGALDRTKRP